VIRVGVNGAAGRMGSTVCDAVEADDELDLVARGDAGDSLETFVDARCDVVVDFTVAAAARTSVAWLARNGVHCVVGTTGLGADDFDAWTEASAAGGGNVLVAANFAISAVLMMRFAEMAAPFFDTAEIIELHHDAKVDAPSGTAAVTAERMATAKHAWPADPTTHETVPGARGGRAPGGIHVHSVRMRGMVAHQEVILGAAGQTLTLRQDSYSRESFMPGVVLACKRIADLPGLTRGLDPVLGL
jgi:4-hydroxy-tetrahydrodipicolinate reductase